MSKVDIYIERYLSNRYKNVNRKTNITPFEYIPKINYEFTLGIDIKNQVNNFQNQSQEITELLSKISYFSCGISRYEILNRYKIHTFNPTARNLHSALIYFLVDNYCFRYNFLKNEFEIFRTEYKKAFNFREKFYILCCNELFGLTSYYGEFSYFLAGLDAGHVLHNIKLILSLEELQSDLIYYYNHKEICDLIGRNYLEIRPFFILEVDKKLDSKNLIDKFNFKNKQESNNIVHENYFEMKQYNILCDLLEQYSCFGDKNIIKQEQNYYKYIRKDEILDSLIKRTSAHNLVGNMCFEAESNMLKSTEIFLKFLDYKKVLDKKNYFKCFFIKNRQDGSVSIIDENKSEHIMEAEAEKIHFNIIHDSYEFFQTHTFLGMIILTASMEEIKKDDDLSGMYLDYSLLMSGDLMQCISLLAAEQDYFCRPIKNYRDDYLQRLLNVSNQVMYAAAIGSCNNANTLTFNIL